MPWNITLGWFVGDSGVDVVQDRGGVGGTGSSIGGRYDFIKGRKLGSCISRSGGNILTCLWWLGLIAATDVTLCFEITLDFDEIADCDAYQWGSGGKRVEYCWGSSDAFGFSIVSAASV